MISMRKIVRKPKLRELKEAIKALIKGPCTTKFPFEPHIPAEKFRGKPEYSEEGCIGCTACKEVCPPDAIRVVEEVIDGEPTRRMELHYDECIFCGQCQALCTTKEDTPPGIKLGSQFALAVFDRKDAVEKSENLKLALCQSCREVITTENHLKWIAEKLGPLAYSNPTLFLSKLKNLALIPDIERIAKEDLTRSDRIKILCAKCRRKTTLEKD